MDVKGRIVEVLEQKSGISQQTGNEYRTQEFVLEYFERETDRYSDRVVLQTFDSMVMEKLKPGVECRVVFGHVVDKYNGRYYNRLRLHRFELLKDESVAASQAVGAATDSAAAAAVQAVSAQQSAKPADSAIPSAQDSAGSSCETVDDLPF